MSMNPKLLWDEEVSGELDPDSGLAVASFDDDTEEPQDLGFIVEDHDDRRATLTGGWQRLDELDTDEPLEINPNGPIPHEVALRERGASPEWFARDYYVTYAKGEAQEADFVETSMLGTDPDCEDGTEDFTDESLPGLHGEPATTDLVGKVPGVGTGLGSSLPQDIGRRGFQIHEGPFAVAPLTEDQIAALLEDEEDAVMEAEVRAGTEQGENQWQRDLG